MVREGIDLAVIELDGADGLVRQGKHTGRRRAAADRCSAALYSSSHEVIVDGETARCVFFFSRAAVSSSE